MRSGGGYAPGPRAARASPWDELMHFIKTKKFALITSVAVLAIVTASVVAPVDARARHKLRQHPAVTAAGPAIDDRYAHVQGGLAPMIQQPSVRRMPRRSAAMSAMAHAGRGMLMNGMSFGGGGLVEN